MDSASPESDPKVETQDNPQAEGPEVLEAKEGPNRGSGPLGAITDSLYRLTAHLPAVVLLVCVVLSALLTGVPFLVFEEAITVDLSLDAYSVRGDVIANRENALEAAWCGGPCRNRNRRLNAARLGGETPERRATSYRSSSDLTVVYAAKDGGNVLTEGRLLQAMELEQRAISHLGSAMTTPLRDYFPSYPGTSGALTGAALDQQLVSTADQLHDTRNYGRGGPWPAYDKNFTACTPQSKLISSTFQGHHDPDVVYGDLLTGIETDDLYLSFFESYDHTWFSDERNGQIMKDTLLLIGVLVSVLVIMIVMTSSPFISILGLLGILLATGVAFCFYRVCVSGWFGILNAFAFFLLMGIGCDDIFVITDTWRQSTEQRGLPPDDYVGRLRYTMPRAGKAVFTTSVTTAVAFFGNLISVIPPLRLFGAFSGLMVVFDFVLTVLYLPAVLVLQQKLFGNFDFQISCCKPTAVGKASKVDSFLVRRFMPWLVRFAPVLVIVSTLIGGISLNLALELPPGVDFHESELFPAGHNQHRAYKAQQMMRNLRPIWVNVNIVHGVEAVDTGDRNNPSDMSDVRWDAAFDVYDPAVQQFTLDLCRALLAERGLVRSLSECWAQELSDRQFRRGRPFPIATASEFDQVERSSHTRGLHWQGDRYWSTIQAIATVKDDAKVSELRLYYDRWEAFMTKWNDEARRRGITGASRGFHTAGRWKHMSTIENLATSSITAIGISVCFVFVMLIFIMQNIAIVGITLVHIIGICLVLITCLWMEGRSLGVLESIALTLMVGLSVDYLAHLAMAYLEEPKGKSRVQLVTAAVAHLGGSVIAGAVTTFIAAVFLCFGKITFFSSFGLFILEIILISVVATLVSFVAVLSLFGPEGGFCQIPLPPCCRLCSSEPKEAAVDTLASEVEVVMHSKKVRWATGIGAVFILLVSGSVRLGLSLSDSGAQATVCPAMPTMEVRFDDYRIPAEQDSYRCRGFDLIPAGCTYYITEVAPLIEPASLTGIVHHMILFATETSVSDCPFTCFDMPNAQKLDAAWAVGMGPVRWPSGTAYAIGGFSQALQMHYENWARQSNLVDAGSGLRLTLTQTPPQNALTNIGIGLHPLGDMSIPPRQPNSTFFVECQPVLSGPVTVVAFATHAHKVGTAVLTQVLRSSQVAGDVGSTPSYNFNFQRVEQFAAGQERQLLPGDIVRVICSYNTMSRSHSTRSGWGSADEMCMTFVFVYPMSNVGSTNCMANTAFSMP